MLRATNPFNGETVREVEPDSPEVVERKLAAAADAYGSWRDTSFEERAELLRAVAAQLREDVDELAPLMTEEMGKPLREAKGEIEKCAWCSEHYADHGAAYLATEKLESDAVRSYVQYLPLGAVLGILPWNSPFWLAFRVAAPALMAGNVVLIKPDPHVPGCESHADRILPKGVSTGAPSD